MALAISTICRRDRLRSRTSARGSTSSQAMRASSASARRRWARRSIRPRRLGGSASEMLSATVRSGISDSSWKMQTMPARVASAGSGEGDGRPARRISPVSGRRTPAMILISVDLPAPFSPSTAWIVPRRQAKSTASRARTPAKCFETPVSCGWMLDMQRAGRRRPGGRRRRRSHVGLGLRHDGGAGDVHAAGRELVDGEEVVGQVGPEVLAVLQRRCGRRSAAAPRSAAASGCPRAPRSPPSSRWRRGRATGRSRCP